MNATISHETKGVQRKHEARLHILPALTIVVLLYTLVMTLTWLREQTSVSLVARPYTAATASDDAEMTNKVLSMVRGWMTTASDSAQTVIDSAPVQTIKGTVHSVIEDMRGLMSVENRAAAPDHDRLWLRYLPMDDTGNFLAPAQ